MTSLPPLTMTSLTPRLDGKPDDVTNPLDYDVTSLSTMTSLPSRLWRHYPLDYDVTTLSTMTSLPSRLWRHYPLDYDVTTLSIMTSLPLRLDGEPGTFEQVKIPGTIVLGRRVKTGCLRRSRRHFRYFLFLQVLFLLVFLLYRDYKNLFKCDLLWRH